MPSYHLAIITPHGITYSGDVVHTLVPAEDGFVGVLANHAPYVTSSPGGRLEVREINAVGGSVKKFTVGIGFFEVSHNKATFLTQSFS